MVEILVNESSDFTNTELSDTDTFPSGLSRVCDNYNYKWFP